MPRPSPTPLALALILSGGAHAAAQEPSTDAPAASARLVGRILIDGMERPLAAAQVELLAQGAYALTDSAGRFQLVSIEPGWDTLQISLLEFASEKIPVFVRPGALHRVELVVPYPFAVLEELTVELLGPRAQRMRGFEQRRTTRNGRFFARADIERRRPVLLSQLLRSEPWIRVTADRRIMLQGKSAVRSFRRTRAAGLPQCRPTIFVDGVRRNSQLTRLNDIDPRRIEGIEIYRAPFIPFRFRDHSRPGIGCGSIVVWTTWGAART